MNKLWKKLSKIIEGFFELVVIIVAALALFQEWSWIWDSVIILVLAWLWARRTLFKKFLTNSENGQFGRDSISLEGGSSGIGGDLDSDAELDRHPTEPWSPPEEPREQDRRMGQPEPVVHRHTAPRAKAHQKPDKQPGGNHPSPRKDERSFEDDLQSLISDEQ